MNRTAYLVIVEDDHATAVQIRDDLIGACEQHSLVSKTKRVDDADPVYAAHAALERLIVS